MLNSLRVDQSAATRSKRQRLDHLLIVSTPHELAVLAGITLLVLLLLAWLQFGRVENGFSSGCILVKPGPRHDVVSTEPGQLLEYFVGPGEFVEAGTPIARQSVPELAREIDALRDRIGILERDALQAGAGDGALHALLASAGAALLQMEALRSVRETVVTQTSGEIEVLARAPGDYLSAGALVARIRSMTKTDDRSAIAVLGVDQDMARRLEPGLPATTEVSMRGGEFLTIPGKLASVNGGPLPGWLVEIFSANDLEGNRVDIALDARQDLSVAAVAGCRARIVLGRISPTELLFPGQI